MKTLRISRQVIDGLLSYAKNCHPREGILLLRGKRKKNEVIIKDLIIPPFAVHDYHYSSFPTHMLPLDLSILGIAHSHPSGSPHPSLQDLNNFYGIIMIIMGYPYGTEDDILAFDREGNQLQYTIYHG
ncbi:MAG: Mov34/MPN/PAD-1 family protein [Thaumarchaeota archaeon]|nr:Mov34/MPN/PAD-1 family protein [Nitrososphaerota archaeon]